MSDKDTGVKIPLTVPTISLTAVTREDGLKNKTRLCDKRGKKKKSRALGI